MTIHVEQDDDAELEKHCVNIIEKWESSQKPSEPTNCEYIYQIMSIMFHTFNSYQCKFTHSCYECGRTFMQISSAASS